MFKYIIYTMIVVGIIYGIILSYPGMFFKHKYEYNNMTISSHQPLKGDVDSIINKVNEKILHAEFFSPDFKFHFYIAKSAGQYSFLTAFKGEGYAYVSPINGNIFLASANFEKKKANCKDCEDLNERELDIIMTSAATNEIIRKRLKFLKYISSPEWKQEGYGEYIAGETGYFEPKQICNEGEANTWLKFYERKLAMEMFLIEDKRTFAEVLDRNFSYESVKKRLKKRHCK